MGSCVTPTNVLQYYRAVHCGISKWSPRSGCLTLCPVLCSRHTAVSRRNILLSSRRTHSVTLHKMGVWCFARGAFTSAGCLGVYAGKYTGRYLCVTFLSGGSAPAGTRVRRYSQEQGHGKDVPGRFVCYHLPRRTLVKIQGADTSPFLQGIITNDMELLEEPGTTAMYSHMLNVQGRTLYDIMLYRYSNTPLHRLNPCSCCQLTAGRGRLSCYADAGTDCYTNTPLGLRSLVQLT